MEETKIKTLLVEEKYITPEDLKKAEDYAKDGRHSVIDYLIKQGLVSRNLLGQAVAESYKTTYFNLAEKDPSEEQIRKIPEAIARKYSIIFVKESKRGVVITSDQQLSKEAREDLKKIFEGKKIECQYSDPDDIKRALTLYRPKLDTRFGEIIKTQKSVAPEIVDQIVEDALILRASDIHFEPLEQDVIIRFRIDGVLQEAGRLGKQYYENVVNRIKVQAKLRIDEHASSQDGSIRFKKDEIQADLRVSIIPTMNGEKVVFRVLSEYVRDLTFSDLGFNESQQKSLLLAAKKPFGMILVTGPTGSGKTTTLYSLVKILNEPGINITTIEDPVEYHVFGVNQIQVNNQTNLTFAKGLRSIARQDPDIILVGEIRDLETAEIAVNAALTGHLLFSTFHANDSTAAIPRILDMGIEPYLLASTLELVIAQRLVRRICDVCRVSTPLNLNKYSKLWPEIGKKLSKGTTVYAGKGCSVCNQTGYKGRIGIFEFLQVSGEIQDLIVTSPNNNTIKSLAIKQGFKTMFDDGLEKVRSGLTTLDELLRVAPPSK